MELNFKKIKIPAISLIGIIIFIALLLFASKKIYYTNKIPIKFLYTNDSEFIFTTSKNYTNDFNNKNYTDLQLKDNRLFIMGAASKQIQRDSIHLFLEIKDITDMKNIIQPTSLNKTDTLFLRNTLYNYLKSNIIGSSNK